MRRSPFAATFRLCLTAFLFWAFGSACTNAEAGAAKVPVAGETPDTTTAPAKKSGYPTLDDFLDTSLCDGFSYPFGDGEGGGSYTGPDGKKFDGWYIATHTGENYSVGVHTGEDWNGKGGGDTDKGQPVFATASGKVLASQDYGAPWGNVVLMEHRFLENGKLRTVHSLYAHLDKRLVEKGAVLKRRQQLGTIGTGDGAYSAHLHFEIRKESLLNYDVTYWPSSNGKDSKWVLEHYEQPSAFVDAHRKLLVPAKADTILIAFKKKYRMYLCSKGKLVQEFVIALGQEPLGHKQQQGDNRTPEGEYRIIQKTLGPFNSGPYDRYLGAAWLRISYPNSYDAIEGAKRRIISEAQKQSIISATKAGKEPPKTTALGGGIGIHGWVDDWAANGHQNLTWGCISLHNSDLKKLFGMIGVPTTIVIHP